MFVLVTGGTGFIGSAVIRALRRRSHTVLALVRDAERVASRWRDGVKIAVGDMHHPETYQPLVSQVDAVIHAAQEKPQGRWTRRKIAAMHQSDALMTRTLASACCTLDKPFIYSSGALTHAGYGNNWIDESLDLRPCLLARGHAEMEIELLDLHQQGSLHVVILSPGFVYGTGGFLKMTAEMLRAGRYRIMGKGTNFWSLVHADDVGDAYSLALEKGRPGQRYFLGDDQPLLRRDVINLIADSLAISRPGHVPAWIIGLFLGSPLVEAANSGMRIRTDKVKQDLGWQPTHPTFAESVQGVVVDLFTEGTRPSS